MCNQTSQNALIKNINSPFTELFSLLVKFRTLPDNSVTLDYSHDELQLMRQHSSNVVGVMLRGLQDVGNLLGAINSEKTLDSRAENFGCIFSSICNLIEALNGFEANIEYVLGGSDKQRKKRYANKLR